MSPTLHGPGRNRNEQVLLLFFNQYKGGVPAARQSHPLGCEISLIQSGSTFMSSCYNKADIRPAFPAGG